MFFSPAYLCNVCLSIVRMHVSPVESDRKTRNGTSVDEVRFTRREALEEAAPTFDLDKAEVDLLEVVDEVFRDRRQSSDPDQLCPTVSNYIMPRAAVNSKGRPYYATQLYHSAGSCPF